MNPNFYYFYEYRNNRKLRNVGFLNLTLRKGAYFLKLSVKQIPVLSGTVLPLFALYQIENSLFSKKVEILTCGNQMLAAQLALPDTFSSSHDSQTRLIGFYLYLPNKRFIAAVVPGIMPNFENISELSDNPITQPKTETLKIPAPDNPVQEAPPSNSSPLKTDDVPLLDTTRSVSPEDVANPLIPENHIPDTDSVSAKNAASDSDSAEIQNTMENTDSIAIQDATENTDSIAIQNATENTGSTKYMFAKNNSLSVNNFSAAERTENIEVSSTAADTTTTLLPDTEIDMSGDMKKISVCDLAFLPRRHWSLANNSFLLHGYHNYGHLLLIKEEQHYWLGIPGIYHPKEARAAEHFGFPQFTRSCHQRLTLSDNECSKHPDFGYWCRYIR